MKTFNGQGYIDFDAPAQAHSATSVEAAKSQTKSKKDGDKQTIIAALELHGPLTDEQIPVAAPLHTAEHRASDPASLGGVRRRAGSAPGGTPVLGSSVD